MKALNRLLAVLAALTLPLAASAQTSDYTFQLKGFVSMTAAVQSGQFSLGEGQQSLAAGPNLTADKGSMAFDVRQSRFNFSVKGPQAFFGATPSAVLEMDLFGGNSAGNFGNVSIYPRVRTVYSQLDWGNHKIQVGQQNDLTFALAPTSLSHIAFPMGYFTGNIGWRRPGLFGFHNIPLGEELKLEIAWEVGRSQGAEASPSNGIYPGEASGSPAIQARGTISNKMFSAFVAGHTSSVDTNGAGTADVDPKSINTTAVAFGGKVMFMGVTLQAAGFSGTNTDPLLGNFVEFRPRTAAVKDLSAFGYWVQAGYNVTKEFSLWGFYGNQGVDETDGHALGQVKMDNTTMNFQAMYREGGYGASVEYSDFKTTRALYTAGAYTGDAKDKANQIMLTGTYFF